MADPDLLARALRYQQALDEQVEWRRRFPDEGEDGVRTPPRPPGFGVVPRRSVDDYMPSGLDQTYQRATILPFARDKSGEIRWAWPGIVNEAVKAFVTPGAVAQGAEPTLGDAVNLATNVVGGGVAASRALPKAVPDGAVLGANIVGPKKQANIDAGLYHPVGLGKKLDVPVSEMEFRTVPGAPMVPRVAIDPQTMQGATLIPAMGDRSMAGAKLESVGGRDLATPVELHGGPNFMRTHAPVQSAWANAPGPTSGLAKKVREAGQHGDVYMPYVAMGHESINFSTMMSSALLEQMRSGVSKTAKKDFDVEMRRVRPEWRGIDDPRSLNDLNTNGAVRQAFVEAANLDYFQRRGFPNVIRTRAAITDPELMSVPAHSAGYTVAKMDPSGRIISNPERPHPVFSHQLGGEYVGGFPKPVPRNVMFPDFYQARRSAGFDELGDVRSFALGAPAQKADQRWLDGIMRFLREEER